MNKYEDELLVDLIEGGTMKPERRELLQAAWDEIQRLRNVVADVRDRSRLGEMDGRPWVIVEYEAWKACCDE